MWAGLLNQGYSTPSPPASVHFFALQSSCEKCTLYISKKWQELFIIRIALVDKPWKVTECFLFILLSTGVQVTLPSGKEITCRATLLNGTFDLPARCLVCNMIQFNAHCGCGLCEEPGETARSGNGFSHVYCMSHDKAKTTSGHAKLRTKESTNENAQRAIANASTVWDNNYLISTFFILSSTGESFS